MAEPDASRCDTDRQEITKRRPGVCRGASSTGSWGERRLDVVGKRHDPPSNLGGADDHFLFLWRLALRRLRYLCFDIFLRRFFTTEPTAPPNVSRSSTTGVLGETPQINQP